jgi:predicted acyltransferase
MMLQSYPSQIPERLLSLDLFRGATMFLLIAEFTHIFSLMYDPALEGSFIYAIIKRISTSSFVIVSGGWTFLTLAFSYWLIDIKKRQKWSRFLRVVGMNPLFIYLFAHVGGAVYPVVYHPLVS